MDNNDILETHNWIKVKKYKEELELSWEEVLFRLELHPIKETIPLINKIREIINSEK